MAQRTAQSPVEPDVGSERLPSALTDAALASSLSSELAQCLRNIVPAASLSTRSESEVIVCAVFRICQSLARQRMNQGFDPETDYDDLLPLGAYHLEVWLPNDDIDLLYLAPPHVDLIEFRKDLEHNIGMHPQASYILLVTPDGWLDAPSLAFRMGGVRVKLMLAHRHRGALLPVPGTIPSYSAALYARRATEIVLSSVPDVALFRGLLKFVRYWAQNRGVYGKHMGFFGGLAWAVLCARVCQIHRHVQLSQLVALFFSTLCAWDWRTPCGLIAGDYSEQLVNCNAPSSSLINVLLPGGCGLSATPYVNAKTSEAILRELRRGSDVTCGLCSIAGCTSGAHWIQAVSGLTFFEDFAHYLEIDLMATSEAVLHRWCAWAQPHINEFVARFGSRPKSDLMLRPWPHALRYCDAEWPHAQALFAGVYLAKTAGADQICDRFDIRESVAQLLTSCRNWPEAENHKDGFELVVKRVRWYEIANWLDYRAKGFIANSGGASFSV